MQKNYMYWAESHAQLRGVGAQPVAVFTWGVPR
jgi:hypothetical protein